MSEAISVAGVTLNKLKVLSATIRTGHAVNIASGSSISGDGLNKSSEFISMSGSNISSQDFIDFLMESIKFILNVSSVNRNLSLSLVVFSVGVSSCLGFFNFSGNVVLAL